MLSLHFRFFVLLLVCSPSSGKLATAQSDEEFPPIENSEFLEIAIQTSVTKRFEIYDPHSLEDLEVVKKMGFDQVILDRAPLHADATQLGLDVVIANWWTDETPQKTIDSMIEFCRDIEPGRLAAISVMDEPERNSPDTPFSFYVDLYQKLKPRMTDELEGVPLEISYWGPLQSWDQRYYEYFSFLYESCDTMRIMPYPDLHEAPLSEVYLMLQRSKRSMRLAQVDLPHVVILQTWVLPPKNELPTIDELRVMAYQAMLGGAETVSFFEYNPDVWQQTPGFTEDFARLMKELVALRDRLTGAQIESLLQANGVLRAKVVWEDGTEAMIRVNTNRAAADDLAALEIDDESILLGPVASRSTTEPLAPSHHTIIEGWTCELQPQTAVGCACPRAVSYWAVSNCAASNCAVSNCAVSNWAVSNWAVSNWAVSNWGPPSRRGNACSGWRRSNASTVFQCPTRGGILQRLRSRASQRRSSRPQ